MTQPETTKTSEETTPPDPTPETGLTTGLEPSKARPPGEPAPCTRWGGRLGVECVRTAGHKPPCVEAATLLSAATALYDGRPPGRLTEAPRGLWADLGAVLYGSNDLSVLELRGTPGPDVAARQPLIVTPQPPDGATRGVVVWLTEAHESEVRGAFACPPGIDSLGPAVRTAFVAGLRLWQAAGAVLPVDAVYAAKLEIAGEDATVARERADTLAARLKRIVMAAFDYQEATDPRRPIDATDHAAAYDRLSAALLGPQDDAPRTGPSTARATTTLHERIKDAFAEPATPAPDPDTPQGLLAENARLRAEVENADRAWQRLSRRHERAMAELKALRGAVGPRDTGPAEPTISSAPVIPREGAVMAPGFDQPGVFGVIFGLREATRDRIIAVRPHAGTSSEGLTAAIGGLMLAGLAGAELVAASQATGGPASPNAHLALAAEAVAQVQTFKREIEAALDARDAARSREVHANEERLRAIDALTAIRDGLAEAKRVKDEAFAKAGPMSITVEVDAELGVVVYVGGVQYVAGERRGEPTLIGPTPIGQTRGRYPTPEVRPPGGYILAPPHEKIVEACAMAANDTMCAVDYARTGNQHPLWVDADESHQRAVRTMVECILAGDPLHAMHERWTIEMYTSGWIWGPELDHERRTDPLLKPYQELSAETIAREHLVVDVVTTVAAWLGAPVAGQHRNLLEPAPATLTAQLAAISDIAMGRPRPMDVKWHPAIHNVEVLAHELARLREAVEGVIADGRPDGRQPVDPSPLPSVDGLNPGITRLVHELRSRGFNTCDSGDGVTHEHACDREYPYVTIKVSPDLMMSEADRLREACDELGIELGAIGGADGLGGPAIQASYDPQARSAIIDLTDVTDAMLAPEPAPAEVGT